MQVLEIFFGILNYATKQGPDFLIVAGEHADGDADVAASSSVDVHVDAKRDKRTSARHMVATGKT